MIAEAGPRMSNVSEHSRQSSGHGAPEDSLPETAQLRMVQGAETAATAGDFVAVDRILTKIANLAGTTTSPLAQGRIFLLQARSLLAHALGESASAAHFIAVGTCLRQALIHGRDRQQPELVGNSTVVLADAARVVPPQQDRLLVPLLRLALGALDATADADAEWRLQLQCRHLGALAHGYAEAARDKPAVPTPRAYVSGAVPGSPALEAWPPPSNDTYGDWLKEAPAELARHAVMAVRFARQHCRRRLRAVLALVLYCARQHATLAQRLQSELAHDKLVAAHVAVERMLEGAEGDENAGKPPSASAVADEDDALLSSEFALAAALNGRERDVTAPKFAAAWEKQARAVPAGDQPLRLRVQWLRELVPCIWAPATPQTTLQVERLLQIARDSVAVQDLLDAGVAVLWRVLQPAIALVQQPLLGCVSHGPSATGTMIGGFTPRGLARTLALAAGHLEHASSRQLVLQALVHEAAARILVQSEINVAGGALHVERARVLLQLAQGSSASPRQAVVLRHLEESLDELRQRLAIKTAVFDGILTTTQKALSLVEQAAHATQPASCGKLLEWALKRTVPGHETPRPETILVQFASDAALFRKRWSEAAAAPAFDARLAACALAQGLVVCRDRGYWELAYCYAGYLVAAGGVEIDAGDEEATEAFRAVANVGLQGQKWALEALVDQAEALYRLHAAAAGLPAANSRNTRAPAHRLAAICVACAGLHLGALRGAQTLEDPRVMLHILQRVWDLLYREQAHLLSVEMLPHWGRVLALAYQVLQRDPEASQGVLFVQVCTVYVRSVIAQVSSANATGGAGTTVAAPPGGGNVTGPAAGQPRRAAGVAAKGASTASVASTTLSSGAPGPAATAPFRGSAAEAALVKLADEACRMGLQARAAPSSSKIGLIESRGQLLSIRPDALSSNHGGDAPAGVKETAKDPTTALLAAANAEPDPLVRLLSTVELIEHTGVSLREQLLRGVSLAAVSQLPTSPEIKQRIWLRLARIALSCGLLPLAVETLRHVASETVEDASRLARARFGGFAQLQQLQERVFTAPAPRLLSGALRELADCAFSLPPGSESAHFALACLAAAAPLVAAEHAHAAPSSDLYDLLARLVERLEDHLESTRAAAASSGPEGITGGPTEADAEGTDSVSDLAGAARAAVTLAALQSSMAGTGRPENAAPLAKVIDHVGRLLPKALRRLVVHARVVQLAVAGQRLPVLLLKDATPLAQSQLWHVYARWTHSASAAREAYAQSLGLLPDDDGGSASPTSPSFQLYRFKLAVTADFADWALDHALDQVVPLEVAERLKAACRFASYAAPQLRPDAPAPAAVLAGPAVDSLLVLWRCQRALALLEVDQDQVVSGLAVARQSLCDAALAILHATGRSSSTILASLVHYQLSPVLSVLFRRGSESGVAADSADAAALPAAAPTPAAAPPATSPSKAPPSRGTRKKETAAGAPPSAAAVAPEPPAQKVPTPAEPVPTLAAALERLETPAERDKIPRSALEPIPYDAVAVWLAFSLGSPGLPLNVPAASQESKPNATVDWNAQLLAKFVEVALRLADAIETHWHALHALPLIVLLHSVLSLPGIASADVAGLVEARMRDLQQTARDLGVAPAVSGCAEDASSLPAEPFRATLLVGAPQDSHAPELVLAQAELCIRRGQQPAATRHALWTLLDARPHDWSPAQLDHAELLAAVAGAQLGAPLPTMPEMRPSYRLQVARAMTVTRFARWSAAHAALRTFAAAFSLKSLIPALQRPTAAAKLAEELLTIRRQVQDLERQGALPVEPLLRADARSFYGPAPLLDEWISQVARVKELQKSASVADNDLIRAVLNAQRDALRLAPQKPLLQQQLLLGHLDLLLEQSRDRQLPQTLADPVLALEWARGAAAAKVDAARTVIAGADVIEPLVLQHDLDYQMEKFLSLDPDMARRRELWELVRTRGVAALGGFLLAHSAAVAEFFPAAIGHEWRLATAQLLVLRAGERVEGFEEAEGVEDAMARVFDLSLWRVVVPGRFSEQGTVTVVDCARRPGYDVTVVASVETPCPGAPPAAPLPGQTVSLDASLPALGVDTTAVPPPATPQTAEPPVKATPAKTKRDTNATGNGKRTTDAASRRTAAGKETAATASTGKPGTTTKTGPGTAAAAGAKSGTRGGSGSTAAAAKAEKPPASAGAPAAGPAADVSPGDSPQRPSGDAAWGSQPLLGPAAPAPAPPGLPSPGETSQGQPELGPPSLNMSSDPRALAQDAVVALLSVETRLLAQTPADPGPLCELYESLFRAQLQLDADPLDTFAALVCFQHAQASRRIHAHLFDRLGLAETLEESSRRSVAALCTWDGAAASDGVVDTRERALPVSGGAEAVKKRLAALTLPRNAHLFVLEDGFRQSVTFWGAAAFVAVPGTGELEQSGRYVFRCGILAQPGRSERILQCAEEFRRLLSSPAPAGVVTVVDPAVPVDAARPAKRVPARPAVGARPPPEPTVGTDQVETTADQPEPAVAVALRGAAVACLGPAWWTHYSALESAVHETLSAHVESLVRDASVPLLFARVQQQSALAATAALVPAPDAPKRKGAAQTPAPAAAAGSADTIDVRGIPCLLGTLPHGDVPEELRAALSANLVHAKALLAGPSAVQRVLLVSGVRADADDQLAVPRGASLVLCCEELLARPRPEPANAEEIAAWERRFYHRFLQLSVHGVDGLLVLVGLDAAAVSRLFAALSGAARASAQPLGALVHRLRLEGSLSHVFYAGYPSFALCSG